MLTIYRRHSENCPHRDKGRKWNRCKCPIWGRDGRKPQFSLGERDWTAAQKVAQGYDVNGGQLEPRIETGAGLVSESITRYRAEMDGRHLRASSKKKYNALLASFEKFCISTGVRFLSQLTLTLAEDFRATWSHYAPSSASARLQLLRVIFRYFVDHEWMKVNLAKKMRLPKQPHKPTLPYTLDEMREILSACDDFASGHPKAYRKSKRLRVLCLVMRYSGLRVGDAASLAVDRIDDAGRLFLYTQKTGVPVHCPLPAFLIEELKAMPIKSPRYWFWSGAGDFEAVAENYRKLFRRIMKEAKIHGAHPHRFRDTFAVELLLKDTPIEDVQKLLGHSSIKITEKHYAPWVSARQMRLEKRLNEANSGDVLAKELAASGSKSKLRRVK